MHGLRENDKIRRLRATAVHSAPAPRVVLAERLAGRRGHFMPASLLDSQLATLEPPGADENAVVVSVDSPIESIVERIVAALTPTGTIAGQGR